MTLDNKYNRLIFYASIIHHNGTPALMIRKIITDKKIITEIANQILKKGTYEINGVLIFRFPLNAIVELYKVGLLDENIKKAYEELKFY